VLVEPHLQEGGCNHTYCAPCILGWIIGGEECCPVAGCSSPVSREGLLAHTALSERLGVLEISCVHTGCAWQMCVAELGAHVRVCSHAPAGWEACGWECCDQHAPRRCTRCWSVRYCSQEHQLLHRPTHRSSCHKRVQPRDAIAVIAHRAFRRVMRSVREFAAKRANWAVATSVAAVATSAAATAAAAAAQARGAGAAVRRMLPRGMRPSLRVVAAAVLCALVLLAFVPDAPEDDIYADVLGPGRVSKAGRTMGRAPRREGSSDRKITDMINELRKLPNFQAALDAMQEEEEIKLQVLFAL